MKAKDITKRSLMLVLVAWITFVSVFHAYETTTECAEWIAGTIATIGAGPMLTALVVGGVVVAGGVAVYKIATTDADDYRSFASGIKQGFQEFVAEQEKQIALEQDSSLTDQEAADIGVANARETVNNFFDNAITTTKNTAKNITFNAQKYWNLYSRIIGDVADNGIDENTGVILPNTVINIDVWNFTDKTGIVGNASSNIGSNTFEYNGKYYLKYGTYADDKDLALDIESRYPNSFGILEERVRIPFCEVWNQGNIIYNALRFVDVGILSQEIITFGGVTTPAWYGTNNDINDINKAISLNNIPTFVVNGRGGAESYIREHGYSILSVSGGSETVVPSWKRTINNTLNSTKFGDAIQTGRRQLVNEGDHIISVFKEDSVPVNKVGLRENEGIMTGDIGWQIPQTWDDYFGGGIPFRDVVGGTGTIAVPGIEVIPGVLPKDVVIDFPADADVQDSADYPDNPADEGEGEKPQETPEKPAQDVFESQGGNFYPAAMDLTNIFPFCIPFDLIYLVEKFDIHGENAPVITIPIMYPQIMANVIGTDRYEVVIDFSDFLVLRNIVRIFLLLGFIIGLLKMTRELIRG